MSTGTVRGRKAPFDVPGCYLAATRQVSSTFWNRAFISGIQDSSSEGSRTR